MVMVPKYDLPTVDSNTLPSVQLQAPVAKNFAIEEGQQAMAGMQKLGAVVNWQSPEEMPQLSKKVFKDHWGLSAVPSLLAGLTAGIVKPKVRTLDRFNAPDAEEYATRTDASIPVGARDGNDPDQLHKAIALAKQNRATNYPTMVILHTRKGCGVSFVEEKGAGNHNMPFSEEDAQRAIAEIRGAK